jgi:hypothetical protein
MYKLEYDDGLLRKVWYFSSYEVLTNKIDVLVNAYDYDPDCFKCVEE